MIWDFIRDFLVQYVFGGITSDNHYFGGLVGNFMYVRDGQMDDMVNIYSNTFYVKIGDIGYDTYEVLPAYITLGDWLSTTATIIIMCLIVFLLVMLVRWVYKTVVSAFLLR